MKRPEASDFETSLRSVLQALALDAEAQIALYEPGRCVPCLLSMTITHWQQHTAPGAVEGHSQDRRQILSAVVDASSKASLSHACYDNRALENSEFASLRRTAQHALRVWGWDTGAPDPQFLYGTLAAAQRATQSRQRRQREQSDARRPGRPKLRYHQKLMQALGVTPAFSERNLQLLQDREQELGIKLPASIVELLSLAGITELFRERSNQDELITNAEFDEWHKLERFGDPREVHQGFLCVAVENQAVVAWYVPLDGSADPPVVHNNDQWLEDLSQTDWVHCADSFSRFVRDMMQA